MKTKRSSDKMKNAWRKIACIYPDWARVKKQMTRRRGRGPKIINCNKTVLGYRWRIASRGVPSALSLGFSEIYLVNILPTTQSKCKFYRENRDPLCGGFYGGHVKPDIFEKCAQISFRRKEEYVSTSCTRKNVVIDSFFLIKNRLNSKLSNTDSRKY